MTIPNNLVDAFNAKKDGELGEIEDCKIGDLLVSGCLSLDAPESLLITRKPIQAGFEMTDAAIDDVQVISMEIILTNPVYSASDLIAAALEGDTSRFNDTWRDKKRQLYQMMRDREVVDTQTHDELYNNTVIQSIIPLYDADNNYDAFMCTVVLERIKLYGAVDDTTNKVSSPLQSVGGM